jgi:hypothetical protein
MLEWVCKSQKHVTRSTFAAELLSAGETIDFGLLIAQILREVDSGPVKAEQARELRSSGGFVPMALYVDARSVYAAITAECIRAPTDKSLLCHVLHVRELLDNRALTSLVWLDTRDMIADGMTKGSVQRDEIHVLMSGTMRINHPAESWESRGKFQIMNSSADVAYVEDRNEGTAPSVASPESIRQLFVQHAMWNMTAPSVASHQSI